MTREDIDALRMPLIALGVTLLVAAGAILYSGAILDDAGGSSGSARRSSGKRGCESRTPAKRRR